MNRTALISTLVFSAAAALAACGGGSGTPPVTVAPGTSAGTSAGTLRGNATLTIRYPQHTVRVTNDAARRPAYVDPTPGAVAVIRAKGTTLLDPLNPANAFFSMPMPAADGTAQLTVSLPSGTYMDTDLQIAEYDSPSSTTLLAQGSNQVYTSPTLGSVDGAFTLAPGGSATPIITMAMNATQIAFTKDPVNGVGAQILNTTSPGNSLCISANTTVYVFAADPLGTITLAPTGYDLNGQTFPYTVGVPAVSLAQQTSNFGAKLVPSILGSNAFTLVSPNGSDVVTATFNLFNTVGDSLSYGYVKLGPGNC